MIKQYEFRAVSLKHCANHFIFISFGIILISIMIKLNFITLLRYLATFFVLVSGFWIIKILQRYSNLSKEKQNNYIGSGITNITKETQGILIISNTPSKFAQILNKQILNGLNSSTCIYVWMDESLQKQKQNFIRKLSYFHKIMSQIIFVDDFVKYESSQLFWQSLQSTNFYLDNIQYVFLDKTQQYIFRPVQEMIQITWIYEKYQLSQINTNIYKKLSLLSSKNEIICREQFNKLLKNSGIRIKRQSKDKQLVISPEIKQIQIMRNYQTSKKVSYLIEWLNSHRINIVKVPELKNKQQQIQIMKVLLILRQKNPKIKIKVSFKNKQFLKKMQRNLILNDLAIHVSQYKEFLSQAKNSDQKMSQNQIVLSTLDIFISNLHLFRNKIISDGLSIGLYISNEQNLPDSVSNQFSVQYLHKKELQSSTIRRNEGVFIISKHERKEQHKIVRQTKKGTYGYQFIKESEKQKVSPRWIKEERQILKPCQSQNPKIAQYYIFDTKPYKNFIQVIKNEEDDTQTTIYWCFPELYELFFALTQQVFISRIGICPELDDKNKKKLIKISVFNDVIGKVYLSSNTKTYYKFLITNQQLNKELSTSNYTFAYSLIKNQDKTQQFHLLKSQDHI